MTWQFLVCQSNSARVSARSWYCETERDGLLLWSSTRLPGQCLTTCIRRILLQAAMIVFQKFDSASPVSLHRQAAISSYWRFTFFLFLMMPHHILKHKHKHILHVLHVHMDTCTPIYHWCIWKWISPHMAIEISKPLDFGIPYFQTNPHTHRHTCNTCNTYNTCMRAFRYATQAQACSCARAHTHTRRCKQRYTYWHKTDISQFNVIIGTNRHKHTLWHTHMHRKTCWLMCPYTHTHRIAAACSHTHTEPVWCALEKLRMSKATSTDTKSTTLTRTLTTSTATAWPFDTWISWIKEAPCPAGHCRHSTTFCAGGDRNQHSRSCWWLGMCPVPGSHITDHHRSAWVS